MVKWIIIILISGLIILGSGIAKLPNLIKDGVTYIYEYLDHSKELTGVFKPLIRVFSGHPIMIILTTLTIIGIVIYIFRS